MRLEGQSKAGFYPTPLEVAQLIRSCLTLGGKAAHLLDPCCGPGTALETVNVGMKGHYRGITHGVELESERAAEAAYQLDIASLRVQETTMLLTLLHGPDR